LPAGFGFLVEMKITDETDNQSKPLIDSLELTFQ
jgi:hypothetical protein